MPGIFTECLATEAGLPHRDLSVFFLRCQEEQASHCCPRHCQDDTGCQATARLLPAMSVIPLPKCLFSSFQP